jgi:hypothetical protein
MSRDPPIHRWLPSSITRRARHGSRQYAWPASLPVPTALKKPPSQHRHMAETNRVLDDHDLEGIALGYGLFYGGAASGMLLNGVRKRTIPVLADASPLSFIQVDDAAAATVAALERSGAGQAFNVADDEPVSWTTFVSYVASRAGAPPPLRVPRWLVRLIAPYAKVIFDGGVCVSTGKSEGVARLDPGVSQLSGRHRGLD